MSKKSIICTILAMSMILAGTGYAYWTDTLNVTTKATTGDLDVTFVDLGLYAQYGNEGATEGTNLWSIIDGVGDDGFIPADSFARHATDYNSVAVAGSIDSYKTAAEGYNSVDFTAGLVKPTEIGQQAGKSYAADVNGSDGIKITMSNIYPGYAQAFRTDIVNLGSIAAKLSNLTFSATNGKGESLNSAMENLLGVALMVNREHGNDGSVFKLANALGLTDNEVFTIGGVDFVRLSALKAIDSAKLENSMLLASPNVNEMDLFIGVAMDPDASGSYTTGSVASLTENKDSDSQSKGAIISIDLLWDQFNAGKDVGSTNILADQNRTSTLS